MVLKDDRIDEEIYINQSLSEQVSEDHIARFIKDIVDQLDFSEIHEKFIGTPGSKAYSRKMLLRIVLLAYVYGVSSSRGIEKLINENVIFMWMSGNYRFSYRTIINFKHDYGDLIKEMLLTIIVTAKDEGMVNLGYIGLDGTIMKANANNNSVIDSELLKMVEDILDNGLIKDKEEDEFYGRNEQGDYYAPKLTLKSKVKTLNREVKKLMNETGKSVDELDEGCLDSDIVLSDDDKRRISDASKEVEIIKEEREKSKDPQMKDKPIFVSLTDPYSRFMKNKKGKIELSYNPQNIVDCESGIILSSNLTQDPTDYYQLIPQLEYLKDFLSTDLKETKILADAGYNYPKGLDYLYDNGLDGYIPSKEQSSKSKKKNRDNFHRDNFHYDIFGDYFISPVGCVLIHQKTYKSNDALINFYSTENCENNCSVCDFKAECCGNNDFRVIRRKEKTKSEELMYRKMEKEENKEIYSERSNTERPFGHIKHNLQFESLNNKDLETNQVELDLIASAHNCRLIHNKILRKQENSILKNENNLIFNNNNQENIIKIAY
jgi:transposase